MVRSRSARPGAECSGLAPYAAAAASELERTLPLIDALLSLARPAAFPVDLHIVIRPIAALYEAIARAAGGSVRLLNDAEQMFVAVDGTIARTLVSELLDAVVSGTRAVTGVVVRQGEYVALRLDSPLSRPIGYDVQRLGAGCGIRLSVDDNETLLLFPALATSGVDSKT